MSFDESKHPRDSDGKFTDGSSDYKYPQYLARMNGHEGRKEEEPQKEKMTASQNRNKTKDEFFGEEFKDVKGSDAIEKLLKEKRGHVKNAFVRPEIGGIDLLWGDEKGGLLHTIVQRDKKLESGKGSISGLDMVRKIPEIIDKGILDNDEKGRINIDYGKFRVGILPTIYDEKLNWIVTAMELLE